MKKFHLSWLGLTKPPNHETITNPNQEGLQNMPNHPPHLDQTTLRSTLHYNPETGSLTWKIGSKRGWEAGFMRGKNGDRLCVMVDGYRCAATHLIWLYMTGEWPLDQVDHVDGDALNNKWGNLREVTNSQNNMNKGLTRNN